MIITLIRHADNQRFGLSIQQIKEIVPKTNHVEIHTVDGEKVEVAGDYSTVVEQINSAFLLMFDPGLAVETLKRKGQLRINMPHLFPSWAEERFELENPTPSAP